MMMLPKPIVATELKEGYKGDRVVEQAKLNGPQIAGYPKSYHQTQTHLQNLVSEQPRQIREYLTETGTDFLTRRS